MASKHAHVYHGPSGARHVRPVVIQKRSTGVRQLFTISEAQQLVDDLVEVIREVEESTQSALQIQMVDGSSYRWSYSDPSGRVEVGDLVEVPFGYDNSPRIGKVVGTGRGTWTGPLKDISARLTRRELS